MSCKKVLVGYFKRFVYTSTPIVLTQKLEMLYPVSQNKKDAKCHVTSRVVKLLTL